VSLLTVDFTEVILVVLPENLPCCYRAREGSIRVTTTSVYSKMSGVGIDRLDLKSVRSLMQPLVIAPVVNVSSLCDVCMATYARPNWSGFMQTVCMGEHESAS